MGCFCSCFRVHDVEENAEVDVSSNKYTCLSSFTQIMKNKYGAFVANCGLHNPPSPDREPVIANTETDTTSPRCTSLLNSPRPNPNTRNLELQPNIVNRKDGTESGPSQVEYIPIEQNVQLGPARRSRDKLVESSKADESEERHSASSDKVLSRKGEMALGYVCCSSDEENVCPTCLEDYTDENPKITTQCKHDYHLGCIYEWMERSPNCPICMKILLFAELT